MITNSKPPPGFSVRPATPEEDMAAFDALPPTVRAALREAPYEMSAGYAAEVGPDAFLEEYQEDTALFTPPRRRRVQRTFR